MASWVSRPFACNWPHQGAKAPPHLIEMTLSMPRDIELPSVHVPLALTPQKESNSNNMKRSMGMNGVIDGDSSDEDNVNDYTSSYSNQF